MKKTLLRVAHVVGSLHHGGAEALIADLLPRLKARGIDLELVAFSNVNPLAERLTDRGIRIDTLGHRGGTIYRLDRWSPTAWRLYRYLQASSPAIVHSHIYMADLITSLAAPTGTKLVSTLHWPSPWWGNSHRLRSKLKTRLDGALARWRDVRLIAVSRDTAEATVGALGVKSERLRIIHNGIDLNRFPFDPSRLFPKDSLGPVLIQVGRLDPPKGHSFAIEAFSLILKDFPKASLLFVGDGPLRIQLEAKVQALGLNGRVRFLGVRDDVPALLNQSDLFWMPSRFEGLPIACLEAMACGLPTVTTNVLGLREVAVDGVTGFVVPPDSPMAVAQASLRILKDPSLAQRMGMAGRQRVAEHFSIEKTADEYVRAYEDILEGRW